MTLSRNLLCGIYGAVALMALIGTWSHNLQYVGTGFIEANQLFWRDTLANPATRSITIDVLFLGYSVLIWMVLEARRLSMAGVWWYFLASLLIAVSVAVPVFLIQREMVLARRSETAAHELRGMDVVGLIVALLIYLGYTAVSFLQG